ncbi:hypothetical protein DN752_12280 [Echinicola strongylocentroti]|uniref:DUF1905 domain-containing protein n=1 Tax=Echinicola strongylocentroti TaxID=1795355 RepID=A0A2Z4IJG8_9BACT|nr:YdeI/OmpD-associated family protein [Echinicola strongylocentroti]AWW30840.1 hypothetical protein DN752_12280 [Echinicola strongylocentroti]
MGKEKPLVNQLYLLEKFPGKGGWTYAKIPEIPPGKDTHFGWVTVRGRIDDVVLEHYKLMPMGNGCMFLPVKAALRKQLKKEAGDTVQVVLYPDETPIVIPKEILECFRNEPSHLIDNFKSLSDGEQKAYFDWIYQAKKAETKADRIAKMMERLMQLSK